MILPGFTTATQYSGAPLPLPIRVSAGFFVTGLSGNILIQILPPRLMWRVMAMRAASICRSVIHAGSRHLSPYSPKLISLPRVATPVMRPRICFRCLTFFGINMINASCPWSVVSGQLQRTTDHELLTILTVFPTRSSAVRTASALALAPSSGTALALAHARFINRIGTCAAGHGRFGVQYFAAVDPNLHANLAKCGFRLSQAVVDVGSKRM